eukprot:5572469-Pyramimonas_sp.AAC.1
MPRGPNGSSTEGPSGCVRMRTPLTRFVVPQGALPKTPGVAFARARAAHVGTTLTLFAAPHEAPPKGPVAAFAC